MSDLSIKQLNESEIRQDKWKRKFGWKYFKSAKPFKRFFGEITILVSSFMADQINCYEKENESLESILK